MTKRDPIARVSLSDALASPFWEECELGEEEKGEIEMQGYRTLQQMEQSPPLPDLF